MNDITEKPVDRFHKPETDASLHKPWTGGCGLLGEMTGDLGVSGDQIVAKCYDKKPTAHKMMEYAPEPLHANEAKVRGVKFTVGNKYPVLDNKESYTDENGERCNYKACYTFKTKDDNEKEVWIDEKYFIPASINLMHETTCGWTAIHDDGLISGDGIEESVDIRKLATEKNVPALEIEDKFEKELQTLSGLKESEYDGTAYHCSNSTGDSYRHSWNTSSRKRKLFEEPSSIYEGIVKDDGNDLMNDATACMAAVDRVFGYNKVVDPDGIIEAISKCVPHLHLGWEDQILTVNGAKTKISYSEVQSAYSGLKALVSAKVSEKTVGRLVANMLKKVF